MVGCLKGHTSSLPNPWCRLTPALRLYTPSLLPDWVAEDPSDSTDEQFCNADLLMVPKKLSSLGDHWRCQRREYSGMNSKSNLSVAASPTWRKFPTSAKNPSHLLPLPK